jgi:TP901-1 family phage major tail protein
MTAQRGKDLLLKVDDGTGTFQTVAGIRTRTFTVNATTVDVTSSESAGQWRELLNGGGGQHAKLSGAGIFKDAATDGLVRSYTWAGTIMNWQVVVPAFGIVQGPFQVSSLEYSGKHDGEVSFTIGLESAGALSFTPAV